MGLDSDTEGVSAGQRGSCLWSSEEDERLAALLGQGYTSRHVAETLGRSLDGVRGRVKRLGGVRRLRGSGTGTRSRIPWTAEDDDQLRFLVLCGWSVRRCAGVLRRSVGGVYYRVARWGGLDALRHHTFAVRSGREVASLVGVSYRTVKYWIDRGWLRAHRNYARRSRRAKRLRFLVSDDALLDLLAMPRSWVYWSPADIADSDWRNQALQIVQQYNGARFWSTKDLAQRHGVSRRLVQTWVARYPASVYFANERWYMWADATGCILPMPETVRSDIAEGKMGGYRKGGGAESGTGSNDCGECSQLVGELA